MRTVAALAALGRIAAGADANRPAAASRPSPRPPSPSGCTGIVPPSGRRSISPSRALRKPRPGDRNDSASSRLVLPAPLGPVSTTGPIARASSRRRAVIAEIGQDQPGHADPAAVPWRQPRQLALPRTSCAAVSIALYMGWQARNSSHSAVRAAVRRSHAHRHQHVERAGVGAVAHDRRRGRRRPSRTARPSPSICSVMSSR